MAQQEIKATVTVNTSDLGNKKKDDEVDRDAPSRKKGKCSPACSSSVSWIVNMGGTPGFPLVFTRLLGSKLSDWGFQKKKTNLVVIEFFLCNLN